MGYVFPYRWEDIVKYLIALERGYSAGHRGMDWRMIVGTPVIAVEDGRITSLPYDVNSGYYIAQLDKNGRQHHYLHLSQRIVAVNQQVKQGQIIAYSGKSGKVTGPHLHLNTLTKPNDMSTRIDFMTLNPTYFNYNPPPAMNRNDVYNLYKPWIDKHKAKAAQVRPDVAKAYGENFYWEHFIQFSNEYYDSIIRMRQLETENNGLKAEIAKLKPNADIVKAIDRLNETIKNKP